MGERALDALDNERFDVIVMDLNMPQLGGLDAARAYRFIGPDSIHVPIIMLSADVTSETMREVRGRGIDAFLPKPVEARRLLDAIAGLIAKRTHPLAADKVGAEAGLAVINPAALAELELIGSGGSFMQELVNDSFRDGEHSSGRWTRPLPRSSSRQLRDLVHAMKGSAVTLVPNNCAAPVPESTARRPQSLEQAERAS